MNRLGEAHVIRNAGGVVTDDAIRSLVISQRLLGTNEIVLIHHTDCGMLTFTDDAVKQSIARVKANPFIVHENVRGFVYDVDTAALREIEADQRLARPAVVHRRTRARMETCVNC